jgi:hypothetical protein
VLGEAVVGMRNENGNTREIGWGRIDRVGRQDRNSESGIGMMIEWITSLEMNTIYPYEQFTHSSIVGIPCSH